MKQTGGHQAHTEHTVTTLTPTAIAWLLRNRRIDGRTVRVGQRGPQIHLVLA